MNLFGLSGLLVGTSCTAMSALVFLKKPSGLINRFWAVFCIAVAFWGFGSFGIGGTRDPELALIYWRAGYIGVTLIPALFYLRGQISS
jgi:hypothetical protein